MRVLYGATSAEPISHLCCAVNSTKYYALKSVYYVLLVSKLDKRLPISPQEEINFSKSKNMKVFR